jgi:hypothetical protein
VRAEREGIPSDGVAPLSRGIEVANCAAPRELVGNVGGSLGGPGFAIDFSDLSEIVSHVRTDTKNKKDRTGKKTLKICEL